MTQTCIAHSVPGDPRKDKSKPGDIAGHNLEVYLGPRLSTQFQTRTDLLAPELAILRKLGPELSGAEVLDIGVGGGRTTAHLIQLGVKYTGIDYSPAMISRCESRYPGLEFDVCDARDLTRFADGRFRLVWFSFNGIDYVSHADRLKVIGEVRRVLAKGGTFVFSSHNRNFGARKRPWALANFPFEINPFRAPVKFCGRTLSYAIGIANHLINRKREWESDEYAIVNDVANNYKMLTYCISVEKQITQLHRATYDTIEVVGVDGRWLQESEYTAACAQDPFLHYVCE